MSGLFHQMLMMIAATCNYCFSFVLGVYASLLVSDHFGTSLEEEVHCCALQLVSLIPEEFLAVPDA